MLGIGYNEVMRAFAKNNVNLLFVAKNADQFIKRKPINIASNKNIKIEYIDTKKNLGKLCEIDRSAAVAVKKIDSNK
ncbi:MAG: ribosomal L7Ae/L30e/S12e/Gadd45 family protein [Bacillota bacterium]